LTKHYPLKVGIKRDAIVVVWSWHSAENSAAVYKRTTGWVGDTHASIRRRAVDSSAIIDDWQTDPWRIDGLHAFTFACYR